jgi:hypothetical protein
MVTNYLGELTASRMDRLRARTQDERRDSLLARAADAIRRALCGLRGHDTVLHFEQKRVMLRCTSCGHDSPGWAIDSAGPRRVFHGDAERHLLRPERVGLRRTA